MRRSHIFGVFSVVNVMMCAQGMAGTARRQGALVGLHNRGGQLALLHE